jgi:hypothetical protein
MIMDSILHQPDKIKRVLGLTSETLILFSNEGVCLDVDCHSDLYFLQKDFLLGKNIIAILPSHTYRKAIIDFQYVLTEKKTIYRKYRIPAVGSTYFAECKLVPFDEMILCRFTDITKRENLKQMLEIANNDMKEIQRIAEIGKWSFSTKNKILTLIGFLTVADEDAPCEGPF